MALGLTDVTDTVSAADAERKTVEDVRPTLDDCVSVGAVVPDVEVAPELSGTFDDCEVATEEMLVALIKGELAVEETEAISERPKLACDAEVESVADTVARLLVETTLVDSTVFDEASCAELELIEAEAVPAEDRGIEAATEVDANT